MPYLWQASFVGTPIWPINITNGPFVWLIPSIYIQHVHLFGNVWSRKKQLPIWATSLQNISKVACKLCQNISKYFCQWNKMQINYLKIIQCDFLDFCFRFRLQTTTCFVSGKTCKIGSVSNTCSPHCISKMSIYLARLIQKKTASKLCNVTTKYFKSCL